MRVRKADFFVSQSFVSAFRLDAGPVWKCIISPFPPHLKPDLSPLINMLIPHISHHCLITVSSQGAH